MLVEIIKILFGGFCVGLASSVTVGPVAVLCIQRTLNKGRAKGFMTGLGITFSDTLYVLCTSFGLSLVMDFLQEKQTFLIVKLVGCAL
jgi:threonine/homoserine/homoserine lactone efflux protein